MPALVDIANLALNKVGSSRITSVDDPTEQARAFKQVYPMLRDAELRSHPWAFSIKGANLGAEAQTPVWRWAYACRLPADYLGLVEVEDSWALDRDAQPDWGLQGPWLVTNRAPPISIRYIRSVEDTELFDALFAVALACRCALEVCERLTNSTQKRQAIERDYGRAILEAMRVNAIERPPQPMAESSWITGRA